MKKLFRAAAVLMIGLSTSAMFTACHSGSSDTTPSPTPVVVEEGDNGGLVDSDQNYEIVAVSNVRPTTVWFNGQDVTSNCRITGPDANGNYTIVYTTNVPMGSNPANGTLQIAAAGYLPQTAELVFGDESAITPLFSLVKASTAQDITVDNAGTTQGDAVVESDEQDEDGNAVATMEVPNGTTTNNADGSAGDGVGFSITAYVPPTQTDANVEKILNAIDENTAEADKPSEAKPVDLQNPVMAVRCTPDGMVFKNNPVTIRLAIPGAKSDFKFICTNNGEQTPVRLQDGKAVITVEHFSDWVFDAVTEITKVQVEKDDLKAGSYTNRASSNVKVPVSYNKKSGNQIISNLSSLSADERNLIETFLKVHLGVLTPVTQAKTANITVHGLERATYAIRQTYKDVTYRFVKEGTAQSIDVVVRRYGAVRNYIERVAVSPIDEHNGGSN